jgi:hypothetical protein
MVSARSPSSARTSPRAATTCCGCATARRSSSWASSRAGRLQGLVAAPPDLTSYKEMLVTREPSSTPKQPTQIVLQGSLSG